MKTNKVKATGICPECDTYNQCKFLDFTVEPEDGIVYTIHRSGIEWTYNVTKCGGYVEKIYGTV